MDMMRAARWGRNLAAATAATALLEACASTAPTPAFTPPPPPAPVAAPSPPQVSPTPGLSPRERTAKIVTLLNDGQREQARADAVELLREEPANTLAKSLFDQIDMEPKLLLGEKNFPYRMQPGDTLAALAQRFLGDRLLFYALARYNGIDRPGAAEVGRTILIPGVPSKGPPRSAHSARPENDETAVGGRLKKSVPPSSAPPPPARDPARAAALRGQALAALNRGAADRAVALLRQAAALDPDSAAVRRDLARAERIQTTVRK